MPWLTLVTLPLRPAVPWEASHSLLTRLLSFQNPKVTVVVVGRGSPVSHSPTSPFRTNAHVQRRLLEAMRMSSSYNAGIYHLSTLWENTWLIFFNKTNYPHLYMIPSFQSVNPAEMRTYVHKIICTRTFYPSEQTRKAFTGMYVFVKSQRVTDWFMHFIVCKVKKPRNTGLVEGGNAGAFRRNITDVFTVFQNTSRN